MINHLIVLFIFASLCLASCKEKEVLKPEDQKLLNNLQGIWVDTTWLNSYTLIYMLDELIIKDHSYIHKRTMYSRATYSPTKESLIQTKSKLMLNNNQISLTMDERFWWSRETPKDSIVK